MRNRFIYELNSAIDEGSSEKQELPFWYCLMGKITGIIESLEEK